MPFTLRHIILLSFLLGGCLTSVCQPGKLNSKYNDSLYLEPPEHHTILKTNPLTILWGTIPLTAEYRGVVEFVTGHNQASQVAISYLGKGPIVGMVENSINNGAPNNQSVKLLMYGGRLQLSHKFYFKEGGEEVARAPYGLYIAPHMSYASATITTRTANRYDIFIRATQFNIALLGGYQLTTYDEFSVDMFIGGGYKNNFWTENTQGSFTNLTPQLGENFYTSHFKFYLGFNIGMGFTSP